MKYYYEKKCMFCQTVYWRKEVTKDFFAAAAYVDAMQLRSEGKDRVVAVNSCCSDCQ